MRIDSGASPGRYAWCLVGMLWLVCFFNYADRQAIFSLFPLLRHDLHLSTLQLGVVGSSFMWVYALSGPAAGWISDRVSPRSVVLSALAFWSLVTAGTALSHSFGVLVFFRTLGGFGEAFYFPAAMALIARYHAASTRSRAMSLHQTSVYAGTIAGGSLAAILAERHGWRVSFIVFGTLGAALAFALPLFVRPVAATPASGLPPPRDFLRSVRIVMSSRSVIVLTAVFAGANFVAMAFLTWLPTFLLSRFHMGLGNAGINSTVYMQVASVAGVLLGGVLADRMARTGAGGRQALQAAGLVCGAPFLFLTGSSFHLKGLIAGLIGFGLCKGVYDANIFASLYDVVPEERRGVAAGLMNSLGWLGGGVAPIAVAAASRRWPLGTCLSATSTLYLLLGTVLLALARTLRLRRSS